MSSEDQCFIWNCGNPVTHWYFLSWERGGLEQRCDYHFRVVSLSPSVLQAIEMDEFEAMVWKIMNE